jgi:hypothetical protein
LDSQTIHNPNSCLGWFMDYTQSNDT